MLSFRSLRILLSASISFTVLSVLKPTPLSAEQVSQSRPLPFSVTEALRPYVDFWKMIFSKYGQHQVVFHYRQHPGVIYSVLDFSSDAARLPEGEYLRLREEKIVRETERIANVLRHLARGGTLNDTFERRMSRLFATFRHGRKVNYQAALEEGQIRTQTGIRERFGDGIRRSSRYLHVIEQIFDDYGLPRELSRLPLVESSFDYTAYSSAGAAGIWQFMRATGKTYMRIDSYVDERRDPVASTRAAAQYLSRAYDLLGAWPLAVTSYNHGVSGVLRAVKETGSREIEKIISEYEGKSFGFASQNFYAEFLAALEVERDAERLFPGLVRDGPWYFDEVRLGAPVGIGRIASLSGVPIGELQRLNPHLLKPVASGRVPIPSRIGVKVPLGVGVKLVRALGNGTVLVESFHPRGRVIVTGVAHPEMSDKTKVSRGEGGSRSETRSKVVDRREEAKSGGVTGSGVPQERTRREEKAKSKSTKDVAGEVDVRVGSASPDRGRGEKSARRSHVVQEGETLFAIAKRNNLTLARIKRLNPGISKRIRPGQIVYLE